MIQVLKNMSYLVLKETYEIYATKNLTDKNIKKNKMTERDVFEKYDNLGKNELNSKSNIEVYVENELMTSIIVHCRGVTRGQKDR